MKLTRYIAAAALFALSLHAHEIEDNRATLVLRDGTHLSMALYLDYAPVLHKALLPDKPFSDFVLTYAAMPLDALSRELERAQKHFESSLRVTPKSARSPLTFTRWTWPDAKAAQAILQRYVMRGMVGSHEHEQPVEIRADAVSPGEITSVIAVFPEEFRRVIVVSYRPNQAVVETKSPSPEIRF